MKEPSIFVNATRQVMQRIFPHMTRIHEIGEHVATHPNGVCLYWYGAHHKILCCEELTDKDGNTRKCKNAAIGLDGKCKRHTQTERVFPDTDLLFNVDTWLLKGQTYFDSQKTVAVIVDQIMREEEALQRVTS